MKVRGRTQVVEDLLPETPLPPLEIENRPVEIRRVTKRLRTLLVSHFESATRLGVVLGPDDLRAVMDALICEADGMSPDAALQCPDEIRAYVRKSMFDELAGEPSNVLYTTQIRPDVVRYEAMPAGFWKACLTALRNDLEQGQNKC